MGDSTQSLYHRSAKLKQFSLGNDSGFRVELLNLGATIRSIRVPGPNGMIDAVLSYPDVTRYLSDNCYLGSTVGRYANRIENAQLNLGECSWQLEETKGCGGHCLHGGESGFSRRFWKADRLATTNSIRFRLISEDGDQGFPG